MANEFAITAATNTLKLGTSREGEATFTVSNTSGQPIRGRAQLVPEDPAIVAWLSLAEDATHDFDAAATLQYTARIAVPPAAAPSRYAFRLDMVGVENPDEAYTRGPSVTLEIPQPEEKKRPFPWWIIAAAGTLMVIVAVVLILVLRPRNIAVPAIQAGSTIAAATETLTQAGLKVGQARPATSATVPEGQVIGTDPAEGEQVKKGSSVDLLVSSGPEKVTVPNVDDRTQADAKSLLEAACQPGPCLDVVVADEPSSATMAGRVTRTDPVAGSQVPVGSQVTVYVSSGPAQETVDLLAIDDVYWDPVGTLYLLGRTLPDFEHGPLLQLWRAPSSAQSRSTPSPAESETIRKVAPRDVAPDPSLGQLQGGQIVRPPIATAQPTPELIIGPRGPGEAAMQFDMTEIPAGGAIVKAELHLYIEEGQTDSLKLIVQQATSPWSEAQPSRPTCTTSGQIATVVPLTEGYQVLDITTLTQTLYNDPGNDHGYCLILDQVGRRNITSREGPANRRPFLTVTYQP